VASQLEGVAELRKKLQDLGDPKATATVLRAAVREPMKLVMEDAKTNLSKISPGKAFSHLTYLGRRVYAGFALRSVRLVVSYKNGLARAILGVRKEAFYVLQFFELGTAHIARQPWLQPAFYKSKDRSLRRLGEVMRDRIERIAKKRGG
jgi:HK97 gp10 family phage protein